MSDERQRNRKTTIEAFEALYREVPSRPSLEKHKVRYRMGADGLTIREVRVKIKAGMAGRGSKPPDAPEAP